MKKLIGVSGSSGIVTGKAFLYLEKEVPEITRFSIPEDQVDAELARLKIALDKAIKEVKALSEKAANEMSKDGADIFLAHLLMLEDVDFHDNIFSKIKTDLVNAEWAFFNASRQLMQVMLASPDPIFRERAVDIKDVSSRVLDHLLSVKQTSLADLDHDVILVAQDLMPSQVLTMNRKHVKGIVMDIGGATSHTAILARAFNIPAVLGLSTATSEILDGDTLVLDANIGEVVINPPRDELSKWEHLEVDYLLKLNEDMQTRDLPAVTKDGHKVLLKANIGIPEEAESLQRYGAEGIGLFRSEFLFLDSGQVAGEEQQLKSYNKVLAAMGKLPVTIRTADIGGDKILPELFSSKEINPLLGWRAIRLSLAMPEFFLAQLKAILRSSVNGNVKIMFPLISGIEELEEALVFLEEAKNECRRMKQPFAENIEVGVMIEVPSAAMTADILAQRADFFSIGTNDLLQYSLAVDRGNEKVSYLAQSSHPGILRFLKSAIQAAHDKGIKAAMCGEMAGDPSMTALLLGLGLDEFSMAASSIPRVKRIIRNVTLDECRKLAEELLGGISYIGNDVILKKWMTEKFPKENG
ncbi:MAG: phosphoenolpyruvate--protein phosphotransferase [Treponema sp.]|nr:phosphoenolpyruvate--protein phosphotransferase [Treponema sp.]